MRFKLTIEYDGGAFLGWQRVTQGASAQGALEEAIFKATGERVEVQGAGRTDSGVHALGQVAHVDIERHITPWRLADAINALVRPAPVSVLEAREAAADFHARFNAVRRVYVYRIANRRAPLALDRGRCWRVPRELDVAKMQRAGQALVGKHDFTTFRDANCQAKSPIKSLHVCDVKDAGEEVHVWCEAPSFLHRQVRSIVGTLVDVGVGRMTPMEVAAALAAKDRSMCGPVAPADGLYLVRVDY